MKKITLLLLSLFSFSFGFSQITITSANAFAVGDNITFQNIFDVDANFNVGPSGANVVWDFTGETEAGSQEVYNYLSPTGLPNVVDVPNTDLAEQLNGNPQGYFYFDTNGGTEWKRSGAYVSDGTTTLWYKYQDVNEVDAPLELYPYDFTYGTSIASLYKGEGDTSGFPTKIEQGQYSFNVDGWGQLRLPHIIYPNALRVHIQESFNLVLYYNGTPIATVTTTDNSYYWFVDGVKGPVMTYVDSLSDSTHTYSGKWFREIATDITTDFIVDTQTGTTDDTFTFTNTSQPIIGSTFAWSFTPNTVTYLNGTDATSVHPEVSFDNAGLYTAALTVTNTDFTPSSVTETKTDYITVTDAPALDACFTASPRNNVAVNQFVNFTNLTTPNNATDGTTYSWLVSPNGFHSFQNFTNATSENPTMSFTQAGTYSVQMVATNPNFSNSPVTITQASYICVGNGNCTAAGICDQTNSVNDLVLNNIAMYPNPTTDILNITSDDNLSIAIFDITGKQIYQSQAELMNHTIDLSKHSKGLYFVKVTKNNKVFTEKIVLK